MILCALGVITVSRWLVSVTAVLRLSKYARELADVLADNTEYGLTLHRKYHSRMKILTPGVTMCHWFPMDFADIISLICRRKGQNDHQELEVTI